MWNVVTDAKPGAIVKHIAGLTVERVSIGLSFWFGDLLDSPDVECIE